MIGVDLSEHMLVRARQDYGLGPPAPILRAGPHSAAVEGYDAMEEVQRPHLAAADYAPEKKNTERRPAGLGDVVRRELSRVLA